MVHSFGVNLDTTDWVNSMVTLLKQQQQSYENFIDKKDMNKAINLK